MKPRLKKILYATAATLAVTGGALAIATPIRANRRFDAPLPDVHASRDPAVIERGRYLVRGAGHCADCHGAPEQHAALEAGQDVPLSGGFEFKLPFGVVRVPNITPDRETGTGRFTDPELARVLRYGVLPDGHMALPFMPFADMSTADLTAIISYLRTQPPVRHAVAPHDVNALGKVVQAFVIRPKGPTQPVAETSPSGPTVENGRYITHNVGNCIMCHTKIDLRTGAFAGPLFGGGAEHESVTDPKKTFLSPNLTPHPRWGWIASWPEEVFVARMKMGKQREGSPMPWHGIKRQSDDDLRAIYRYLRTVPPAEGGPDPSAQDAVVVVLGGWAAEGASSSGNFALARYTADGLLDPSFAGTGTVITPIAASMKADQAHAVMMQLDERIPAVRVVAAGAANGSDSDFAIARYWH